MGRRKRGDNPEGKVANHITLCCFGGDEDHGERNCQHPVKVKELGLEDPYDIAVVIAVDVCFFCPLYRRIPYGKSDE